MRVLQFLLRALPRTVAMLVFAGFIVAAAASEADARTLVFIHGKNEGKLPVSTIQSTYWTQEMIRASTKNYVGKYLVVSYDGTKYYWDSGGDVATQINNYITANPSERLIFVCHSYGGIMARWILCNSTPGSPYYNYQGANFARIANQTDYVITLASPHGGSEVADLGSTLSNSAFTSWIVTLVDNNTDSAHALTSAHLQGAATTWLADRLRSKAIYTVAGTATLNHVWHLNDVGLGTLSLLAPFNGPRDGLVAQWSAHYTGAPGYDWYNTTANHDHNRHNDDPGYLGNVIGTYGW
jgi:triacylglycerol esterase/lipase EstA (alpha/beta hydrolase family)